MSENENKRGLSPKQEKGIEALLNGLTKGQAAGAAGVNKRTFSRWLADDEFSAALTNASDQAIGDATRRLVGTLDAAINVLSEVMDDKSEKAPARIRAAELVITRALDMVEMRELIARIDALEQRIQDQ